MRSTLATFTKQTVGSVRRRTSTKTRSIKLVVRSFLQRVSESCSQQLRQISFELPHHYGILRIPAFAKVDERHGGLWLGNPTD